MVLFNFGTKNSYCAIFYIFNYASLHKGLSARSTRRVALRLREDGAARELTLDLGLGFRLALALALLDITEDSNL